MAHRVETNIFHGYTLIFLFTCGLVTIHISRALSLSGFLVPPEDFVSRQLKILNSFRQKVGYQWNGKNVETSNIKKLVWDHELARQAEHLASCDAESNLNLPASNLHYESRFYSDYAVQPTPGYIVASDVGKSSYELSAKWYSQRKYFNYTMLSCARGKDCSGFLQLAWAEADRVGCHFQRNCKHRGFKMDFLVCYFNAQAIPYESPFSIGESCTKCPDSHGFCENDLCVSSCAAGNKNCECKKTCYKKDIGRGSLDPSKCTCICEYGYGVNCDVPCKNPAHYIDFDICAEHNSPSSCAGYPQWQTTWCPENCDYGCKRAPWVPPAWKPATSSEEGSGATGELFLSSRKLKKLDLV